MAKLFPIFVMLKGILMLIYNTTYTVNIEDARNFLIWINEYFIPEVEKTGLMSHPRLLQILSHKETDSECFSLQWEVADAAVLHQYYTKHGVALNQEMLKVFKNKVVEFPTLMEVIR